MGIIKFSSYLISPQPSSPCSSLLTRRPPRVLYLIISRESSSSFTLPAAADSVPRPFLSNRCAWVRLPKFRRLSPAARRSLGGADTSTHFADEHVQTHMERLIDWRLPSGKSICLVWGKKKVLVGMTNRGKAPMLPTQVFSERYFHFRTRARAHVQSARRSAKGEQTQIHQLQSCRPTLTECD